MLCPPEDLKTNKTKKKQKQKENIQWMDDAGETLTNGATDFVAHMDTA